MMRIALFLMATVLCVRAANEGAHDGAKDVSCGTHEGCTKLQQVIVEKDEAIANEQRKHIAFRDEVLDVHRRVSAAAKHELFNIPQRERTCRSESRDSCLPQLKEQGTQPSIELIQYGEGCPQEMTATFVNNVGVQTPGSQAYAIDSDTFVFGAADGGWFKMVAVDASGSFKECRYMQESLAGDASAVESNWPSANLGGSYSVTNVEIPATCASDAAAATGEPCSATFIDNVGNHYLNKSPVKINDDTFVIGVADGGLFKMVALDAEGKAVDARYMSDTLELTAANWEGANRGSLGSYSATDVQMSCTDAPTTTAFPFRSGQWLGPSYEYLQVNSAHCGPHQLRAPTTPLGASGDKPARAADRSSDPNGFQSMQAVRCLDFADSSQFEATGAEGSMECSSMSYSYVNGLHTKADSRYPGDVTSTTKWCTTAPSASGMLMQQFVGRFSSADATRIEGYHYMCCGAPGLADESECMFPAIPICRVAKRIDCTICPHADCGDQESGVKCIVQKRAEVVKVCFDTYANTGAWDCAKGMPSSRQCYTPTEIPSNLAGLDNQDIEWCAGAVKNN